MTCSVAANLCLGSFFLAAVCLSMLGCSDAQPKRVPVSGTVLIDGKPLATGTIRFVPEHGRPASSAVLADGSFDLAATSLATGAEAGNDIQTGVEPGKHRIEIAASEVIDEVTIRWHAPKKYASFRTSGLEQTIEGPTEDLVIDLTWDGVEGPVIEEQEKKAKDVVVDELTSEPGEKLEEKSAESSDTNDDQ